MEKDLEKFNQILSSRNAWFVIYLAVLTTMSLVWAKQNYIHKASLKRIVTQSEVDPEIAPPKSQESIDTAMKLFDIKLPAYTPQPTYDAGLKDRGLTTSHLLSGEITVTIGPAAFESWALLGSTLAHEIEIHCRQPLTLVLIGDFLGFDGTGIAEREAYEHELASRDRFQLSALDSEAIQETMNFYYPRRQFSLHIASSVQTWLSTFRETPNYSASSTNTDTTETIQR